MQGTDDGANDEQNDYIVKLFFELTPDTRFISDVFTLGSDQS